MLFVTFTRDIRSERLLSKPMSIAMSVRKCLSTFIVVAISMLAPAAWARLGETEAQSEARYGAPVEGLIGADEKPLLAGAVERAYNFEGWRVRAAFAAGTTIRIQYVHIENNAPKKLTEAETKVLLEAEKGKYSWHEERSKSAGIAGELERAIKAGFSLNKWERTDHAKAELVLGIAMQFETRDADTIEKKLAKMPGAAKPVSKPVVPKF
jgi:hypothetical protein